MTFLDENVLNVSCYSVATENEKVRERTKEREAPKYIQRSMNKSSGWYEWRRQTGTQRITTIEPFEYYP
jgi:hypothetical protein